MNKVIIALFAVLIFGCKKDDDGSDEKKTSNMQTVTLQVSPNAPGLSCDSIEVSFAMYYFDTMPGQAGPKSLTYFHSEGVSGRTLNYDIPVDTTMKWGISYRVKNICRNNSLSYNASAHFPYKELVIFKSSGFDTSGCAYGSIIKQ